MTYVKTYFPTLKTHVVNLNRDAKDLSRDLQWLEVRGKLGSTTGADPGFFLGGGALVFCSTSTPINHIVFCFQNTSCIRKPQVISGGGGGCAPPAPSL